MSNVKDNSPEHKEANNNLSQATSIPLVPTPPGPPPGKTKSRKLTKKQRSRERITEARLTVSKDGNETDEKKEKKEKNSDKRRRVVRELLESEKAHVHALDIAVNYYLKPLQTSNILPAATIRSIFSNLEAFLQWNQTFLTLLEDQLESGDTFGALFLRMITIMRQLYTQYNENYESALAAYEKAKRNKNFSQFLEKTQKETNAQKDLLTYLYLPVQRMLAYNSLLKDILKFTPRTHSDFRQISNSLTALRDIEFSGIMRAEQRKNQMKVLYIQNNMIDDIQLALPHRRFAYEGEVLIVTGLRYARERFCFLFNDLIVCCKPKRQKKLELDWKEPLETINVEPLTDFEDFRYLFRLTSSTNEYILSSTDKNTWIRLINSCKKELKLHPPVPTERDELNIQLNNELEESSKKSLINRILTWSKCDDADVVHSEIKHLATVLEKYKTLNGLQLNFPTYQNL